MNHRHVGMDVFQTDIYSFSFSIIVNLNINSPAACIELIAVVS